MTHDAIIARSFGRFQRKKLVYGAFILCSFLVLSLRTVFRFRPYLSTTPTLAENVTKQKEPPCHVMDLRSDLYNITGEVRVHAKTSTIFIPFPKEGNSFQGYKSWKIRPYARNNDLRAMNRIREWSVVPAFSDAQVLECSRNHTTTSILFSTGGYAGHHFHDFSDIIIPLYLTSRPFSGKVTFLISDSHWWWVKKFRAILQNLSYHPLIDIDQEEDVHCFPSIIMGLQRHGELNIDPSKSPYTMRDFREFLRSTYSLPRRKVVGLGHGDTRKPRLLIISRKRTRSFTNSKDIAETAGSMGFEVIVTEADIHIARFAEIVNSCDVVMGIHGAGLTNVLFLPQGAVVLQVVPLGGVDLVAKTYFGVPSKEMNIRYLEYKIGTKESTLIEQFSPEHMALKNPYSFHRCNAEAFKSAYLDKQNVTLDVGRFKPTLFKALELLHE